MVFLSPFLTISSNGLQSMSGKRGYRPYGAAALRPKARCPTSPDPLQFSGRRVLRLEQLETRALLSGSPLSLADLIIKPIVAWGSESSQGFEVSPLASGSSTPVQVISPTSIRSAYGLGNYSSGSLVGGISINGVAGDGSGQTIAIIDAYNDPNAAADLNAFSTNFGLPTIGSGGPTFTVLDEYGNAVSTNTSSPDYVSTDPAGPYSSTGGSTWEIEESLDIEWAHVIAPEANINLYEAASSSDSDLYTAVKTADATTGVVVVSMSFGGNEASTDSRNDSDFTTPSGHLGGLNPSDTAAGNIAGGITFVASAGDDGAYALDSKTITPQYPASSPNVIAVGGTYLASSGSGWTQTAWGNGTSSGTSGGGGGGISKYEAQPSYQNSVVSAFSTTKRTYPDISLDASPSSGVAVYDSWDFGSSTPWCPGVIGGTSLASPMMAGMVAIADEARAVVNVGSLNGLQSTLPKLYAIAGSTAYATDFTDITSGNNGYAAGTGYDLASGIGAPLGNTLLPALAGGSQLVFSQGPSNTIAGDAFSPSVTVKVEDAAGNVATSDNSTVTIALASNPGSATLNGTLTAVAVNGVATFNNLSISTGGTGYTLEATDASLAAATSTTFNVTAATPPTVQTAAAIAPAPVTGATANLSVLGADIAGESSLIYTWTTTAMPLGIVAPSFSLNGTNAAKNTVVTFTCAGPYTLEATIVDASGLSTTSSVSVIVNQTYVAIAIAPLSASLASAGTDQFTATIKDQFGNVVANPPITWTASAGSITSSGFYTAPYASSNVTITATSGSLVGTATVTVTNSAPTVQTAAAITPAPVTGATAALSVLGADDAGESNLKYTWSTLVMPQGITAPSFSTNGTNAAKNTVVTFTCAGRYTLEATIVDASGLSTTSSVNVIVNQTYVAIAVAPLSASLASAGTDQFTATIKDQFGNVVANPPITWTASAGSINSSGFYTAPYASSNVTITATSGSLVGTAAVTVTNSAPAVQTAAAIAPAPVTGATAALSVLGADDAGESNLKYTWSTLVMPQGITAPSFSTNGTNAAKNTVVTFTCAGRYTLEATITDAGGLSTTSSVSVIVNQTYVALAITPLSASLASAGTDQFMATIKDQFGNVVAHPPITWTASAGTINASGFYTAPYVSANVTITAASGSLVGTASVTVTNTAPTVQTAAASTSSTVTGTTAALSVLGADDAGESNLTYNWSASTVPQGAALPTFSANGTNAAKNTTATFSQAGSYVFTVTITDAGGLSTTSTAGVTVLPTFSGITVAPQSTTVEASGTAQFTATSLDQFGAALASQPAFTWQASAGNINSNGLYTSPDAPGTATISVGSGSYTATATVTLPNGAQASLSGPASWTTASWIGQQSGTTVAVPGVRGVAGDMASLMATGSGSTMTLDGSNPSLAALALSGPVAIAQGSGGSLTLASSTQSASLTASGGAASVSAPVVLANNTVASTSTGSSLALSGNVSGSGSLQVTTGTVTLSGTNTFSGGTLVTAGKLILDGAASLEAGSSLVIGTVPVQSNLAIGVAMPSAQAAAISTPAIATSTSAASIPSSTALSFVANAVSTSTSAVAEGVQSAWPAPPSGNAPKSMRAIAAHDRALKLVEAQFAAAPSATVQAISSAASAAQVGPTWDNQWSYYSQQDGDALAGELAIALWRAKSPERSPGALGCRVRPNTIENDVLHETNVRF